MQDARTRFISDILPDNNKHIKPEIFFFFLQKRYLKTHLSDLKFV